MKESFATPILLALLLVGVTLGISSVSISQRAQLAQVSGSFSSSTDLTGTTNSPVTFSVTVSTAVNCGSTNSTPTKNVMLTSSPSQGGYFSLYGPGGSYLTDKQPGVYELPAGTYAWEGRENGGYMRTTPYTGTFVIEGICANTQTPVTFDPPIISSTNVDCMYGTPRAQVFFGVNPPSGGYVEVSGNGSSRKFEDSSGFSGMLNNGTYSWQGYAKSGYVDASQATWPGSFTIDSTCPSGTVPPTTASTTTTTPPPISLLPVRFKVIAGAMCTPEKNATQVVIEIEPSAGGTVAISKEGIGMVNSSAQGVQYLPNGTYTWQAVPKPGYTILGDGSGTLSLSVCPLPVKPVVSVGSSCDPIEEGVPVVFGTAGPGKAYFSVLNLLTQETLPLQPGTEFFPNGTYSWTMIPANGSTAGLSGVTSGNFSVSACKTQSTTAYVPPKAGTLLFFRDGKLVDPIVRQGEKIAIRVDVSGASSVLLERVGKDSRDAMGAMEKDPGTSRWLYVWDVGAPTTGDYNLVAKATGVKGETVSGSRIVTILPALKFSEPPSIPAPLPIVPKTILDEPTPLTVPLPDVPVFTRLSAGMLNTDTTITLPVRGVADLVSTADILSVKNTLPDAIRSPEDLRVFCASEANDDVCFNLLPEGLREEARGVVDEARKVTIQAFAERPLAVTDTDNDGISDFDETHFYGTNPEKVDTDADGKNDQDELLSEGNPLERGGAKNIVVFENPAFGGVEKPELFTVRNIEVSNNATPSSPQDKKAPLPIRLTGQALPNTIVTLYVYSDPIVVRVKADESGLWSYTLTKELPDGSHTAYIAMTDSAGRVLAKSAPLPFVKEAAAVSFAPSNLPGLEDQAPSLFSGASLYALISIIIGVIGFAFIAIGVVLRSRREDIVIP